MDWLKQEPKGFEVVKFIARAILLVILFSFSAAVFIEWLGVDLKSVGSGNLKILSISFPFIVLIVVMFEELVFRFMPLAMLLDKDRSLGEIVSLVVGVSALFGYLHGGFEHIFIQGTAGVIFSVVFIKCGGINGNFMKAYICSTACHYFFNMIVIGLGALSGVEKF